MKLHLLVGTMTGTAQLVAQELELAWGDDEVQVETLLMDKLDSTVFAREGAFLIVTSTYGQGDVPDNARMLYDSLDSEPKFLGHVRYGVLALGDRTYLQTFCFGGKKFDERLQGLGAQRIGEVWCHDASSGTMPETEGTAWCRQWLTQALQAETAGSAEVQE